MTHWCKGEGIWEVMDPDNAVVTPTATSISNTSIDEDNTSTSSSILFGKGVGFGGAKSDGKVQYEITKCLDKDDQELVAEAKMVREIWILLTDKYKEKLQTAGREYLKELTNYNKSPEVSIRSIYTDITKKSRKIAELQPNLKALVTSRRRFQTLLQSLPQEYDVIRDVIDAQDDLDIEKYIQKLEEKEAQIRVIEIAI